MRGIVGEFARVEMRRTEALNFAAQILKMSA
jgi:hypothetical protein